MGEETADTERIKRALEQVALDKWAETLPKGLETPMNEAGTRLSGGQKQRLGMARALYKQCHVLLLDEAASALDKDTEREINETIARMREKDKTLTILYIAHHESALAICDRVVEL